MVIHDMRNPVVSIKIALTNALEKVHIVNQEWEQQEKFEETVIRLLNDDYSNSELDKSLEYDIQNYFTDVFNINENFANKIK